MDPKLKIISDHLRSSCFLIADGIMPSNEGRGYVLRRIMRRAMLQIHKLGSKEALMYKLVDPLINEMGEAYPELTKARDVIADVLKNEEERFRETIDKGLKILNSELQSNHSKNFSGKIAFKLYDTYGFPLDLTQDILKDDNISVNLKEFDQEMAKQKEMARKNWSGSGEKSQDKLFFDLKKEHGATTFLGYDHHESTAKIIYINNDDNPFIILDQTPFYATSGGQKGDEGTISINDVNITVTETKKFADDLFVHFTKDRTNFEHIKIGDDIHAKINIKSRQEKAANHSATHLMHKALKEILGNTISQKGSNVDSKSFTFDFNFNRAMTPEEINSVENIVNNAIHNSHATSTQTMELEDAKNSGAEALFGEKYDDKVRVVKIGDSVELCGGTHVENSADIKKFKIISEKSIASGIRRIEAKTAQPLEDYLQAEQEKNAALITEIKAKITIKNKEISTLTSENIANNHETINNIKELEEILKQKDKKIDKLKKESLLKNLDDLNKEEIGNMTLINHIFENCEAKDLREIANQLLTKNQQTTLIVIFATNQDKVATCVALSNDLTQKFDANILIRTITPEIGGKGGGGKKDLAMGGGNNKDGINNAIAKIKEQLS